MPNTTEEEVVLQVSNKMTWIDLIWEYLQVEVEPEEEEEKRKLRIRTTHFSLIDGLLYKWSFSMSNLRCLTLTEAKYTMREVYKGI